MKETPNVLVRIGKAVLLTFAVAGCLQDALALDITDKAVGAYFRHEYNRTFGHIGEGQVTGDLRIDSVYTGAAGFSYGRLGGASDVKFFALVGAAPFPNVRALDFSLSYIYNGLPAYEMTSWALMPAVSYRYRRVGASVGTGFCFTSFFASSAIFEYLLLWEVYIDIINKERLRVGLNVGNKNEFYVGSKGAHSPLIFADVHVFGNWRAVAELEYLQSGGDGLAAVFYGLAWRGGVRYFFN